MWQWKEIAKRKRLVFAAGGLVVCLIIYGAVVPAVVAKRYLNGLHHEVTVLEPSLRKVATNASLPVFEDPDVSLNNRLAQLETSAKDVQTTQRALENFDRATDLTPLPGSGVGGDYHVAAIRERQAENIVPQSKQVLSRYQQLVDYLSLYTSIQIRVDNHLDELNSIEDFDQLKGKGSGMYQIGQTIKDDLGTLQKLTPPAGFERIHAAADETLQQAAEAFENLGRSLNTGNDRDIYRSVANLEAATLKNDSQDKDALVAAANDSTTLLQLAELPEKADRVREQL